MRKSARVVRHSVSAQTAVMQAQRVYFARRAYPATVNERAACCCECRVRKIRKRYASNRACVVARLQRVMVRMPRGI